MNDLPKLPEPGIRHKDVVFYSVTFGDIDHPVYSAEKLRAYAEEYAQALVLRERQACWDAINAHITSGELPGSGWDQIAQRNGLILASNIIGNRIAESRKG